ncbi:MAG: diguanylate cyclase [Candidatus Xenobia bacterium]
MADVVAESTDFRDELTGLLDRRYWTARFPVLTAAAVRDGTPLSVGLIEIDNLLLINQTFGYSDGNMVLCGVADLLRDCGQDVVPLRYSGDKFCLLMPGLDAAAAVSHVKAILDRVRGTRFQLTDGPQWATLSVGVASCPDDSVDPGELMHFVEQALEIAIRSGRDRVCSPADLALLALDKTKLHLLFPTATVFGREPLLSRIGNLLARQTASRPLILVHGARGSGISRVIDEGWRSGQNGSCEPLLVRCLPFLMHHPFGALVEALQRVDPRVREQMLSRLSASERVALGRVLPEWSRPSVLSTSQEVVPPGDPLQQLEDIFATLLLAPTEEPLNRVLALFVDDAQWLDSHALRVIQKVRLSPGAEHCAVVMGVRSQDGTAGENLELVTMLQSLHDLGGVEFHELAPLSRDDVGAWLREVLPRLEVPARAVDLIYSRSHGLPLLVEEVVKFLIGHDFIYTRGNRLQFKALDDSVIPENLAELLFARNMHLDEELVRVLSHTALLGRTFERDTASHLVPGLTPEEVSTLLEWAARHGLIREDTDGFYSFASQSACDSFAALLPPGEQRRTHALIAEREEARAMTMAGIPAVAGARVAFHWQAAAEPDRAAAVLARVLGPSTPAPGVEPPPPLTGEQIARVLEFLRSLRLAALAMRAYGAENDGTRTAIQGTHEGLKRLLETVPAINASWVDGELILNGKELAAARGGGGRKPLQDFADFLTEASLFGLTFHRGVTIQEMTSLLDLLARSKTEIVEHGGWPGALEKVGIVHIEVNKRIYVTLPERGSVSSRATVRKLLAGDEKNPSLDGQTVRQRVREALTGLLTELDALEPRRLTTKEAERLFRLVADAQQFLRDAIADLKQPKS